MHPLLADAFLRDQGLLLRLCQGKDGISLAIYAVVLPIQEPFPSRMMAGCQGKRDPVLMREIREARARNSLPFRVACTREGQQGKSSKKGNM